MLCGAYLLKEVGLQMWHHHPAHFFTCRLQQRPRANVKACVRCAWRQRCAGHARRWWLLSQQQWHALGNYGAVLMRSLTRCRCDLDR